MQVATAQLCFLPPFSSRMIFPVIRYAAPFGDCHELIRLETRYRLVRLALRPLDFYFVNLVGGAQPYNDFGGAVARPIRKRQDLFYFSTERIFNNRQGPGAIPPHHGDVSRGLTPAKSASGRSRDPCGPNDPVESLPICDVNAVLCESAQDSNLSSAIFTPLASQCRRWWRLHVRWLPSPGRRNPARFPPGNDPE
jgi:hypothetical protein